jgi:hypothetical protein
MRNRMTRRQVLKGAGVAAAGLGAAAVGLGGVAHAAIIDVDPGPDTLSAAIEEANDGDTLLLAPGNYELHHIPDPENPEYIDYVIKKALTIKCETCNEVDKATIHSEGTSINFAGSSKTWNLENLDWNAENIIVEGGPNENNPNSIYVNQCTINSVSYSIFVTPRLEYEHRNNVHYGDIVIKNSILYARNYDTNAGIGLAIGGFYPYFNPDVENPEAEFYAIYPKKIDIQYNEINGLFGGLGMFNTRGTFEMDVRHNECRGGRTFGLSVIAGQYDGGIIKNNTFESRMFPLDIEPNIDYIFPLPDAYVRNLVIQENVLQGNADNGIMLAGDVSGCSFANNDLSGLKATTAQVYVDSYSHYNQFTNNDYGSLAEVIPNPDYLDWLENCQPNPQCSDPAPPEIIPNPFKIAGIVCMGNHNNFKNENFLGNYPGWTEPYYDAQGNPRGLGCILLRGTATDNKVTALKNGVAMHGYDLCEQVLNLPDYEDRIVTFAKPGATIYPFPFYPVFSMISVDDTVRVRYNFGSAGSQDPNNPTTGQSFQRQAYQVLNIVINPNPDCNILHDIFFWADFFDPLVPVGNYYVIYGFKTEMLVKTQNYPWYPWPGLPVEIPTDSWDGTIDDTCTFIERKAADSWNPLSNPGIPLEPYIVKNNSIPGYEKCLRHSDEFITAIQEKTASLSGRLQNRDYFHEHGMENWPWPTPEEICVAMGKTWNSVTKKCED